MSEYSSRHNDNKIDLNGLLDRFLDALKHLWVVMLVLVIGFGLFSYLHVTSTYTPVFTASATVSVSSSSGSGNDYANAEQLGKVFPYILNSGVLNDRIEEDLGTTYIPGSIFVTNIGGTNLLTIHVTSSNALDSYNVLQSVIRNYPDVARYVSGNVTLTVIDDNGVPEDTGETTRIRGSVRDGVITGMLISLVLLLSRMMFVQTVNTEKDVRNLVHVPFLGSLPIYKKKERKKGYTGISILENNVQQNYLESIRLIRTRVEKQLDENHYQLIMVTSSVPGEGKSTVAANLAVSLAGKGRPVILIDCDLRNPAIQETLNIKGEYPGLEAVLAGKASIKQALYSYEGERGLPLLVMPGGKEQTDGSNLLGSERMSILLDHLKQIADVIILDTPPSAILVDAMQVARFADMVLYVIHSDYARRNVILRGIRELSDTGVKIGGVILNGCKETNSQGYRSSGYYGNYGHYYGKKNG